nr:hypothetical protein [Leucobacter celer]
MFSLTGSACAVEVPCEFLEHSAGIAQAPGADDIRGLLRHLIKDGFAYLQRVTAALGKGDPARAAIGRIRRAGDVSGILEVVHELSDSLRRHLEVRCEIYGAEITIGKGLEKFCMAVTKLRVSGASEPVKELMFTRACHRAQERHKTSLTVIDCHDNTLPSPPGK